VQSDSRPDTKSVQVEAPETTAKQPPSASMSNARVTISVDAQLREAIVKVVDPKTGEVLRQIPPEERLRQQRAYLDAQHHKVGRE